MHDDTIIAISTAAGISPRGIVRLSGSEAFALLEDMLLDTDAAARGQTGLAETPPYSRRTATLALAGGTQLPAELYLMRAPYSYTREDIVEIHTFGSPVLLEMIVEDFLARGARLAEAGEFTRRAFLNGRIDLAQAEAVLQIIHSRSESEMRLAMRQLGGKLSHEVAAIRDSIIDLCAQAELSIDFSDQDIELFAMSDLCAAIERLQQALGELVQHGRRQDGGKPGVSVAIVGRPNAGKSSLLNALLGRTRSIVTHLPGTTRDTVEDLLELEGILFRLSDTAGTRDTDDAIEREAVQRAADTARGADLVLLVLDATQEISDYETKLWKTLDTRAKIAVVSKTDIAPAELPHLPAVLGGGITIETSCVTGSGIENLRLALLDAVRSGNVDCSTPSFLLNARHAGAMRHATEALERAAEAASEAAGIEFVALELRTALDALGEITGQTCTDDILNRIFSNFCIGK